jgi:pimeloyl-ACP methyl ester carboxylesterase
MMLTRLAVLVTCLFLFILPTSAQQAEFVETDCPFPVPSGEVEGETLICGIVIVPESRIGLSDHEIELAVAILKSVSSRPAPDPVIYFEGGPGGSALTAVDEWAKSALREYGDLIIFDQRGTGYSYPSLDCDEWLSEEDFGQEDADLEAICRDILIENDITIAAYTSAESAADVEDILDALDIDQVNLYGISYGTRLALTVVRDYPKRVRSMIIDGVYPPNVQGYEEQPINGYAAFQVLFRDCNANPECRRAYGDLEQLLLNTVDALNEEPMIGEGEDGEEVEIYGTDIVDALFQAMYDTNSLRLLPAQIYAASIRDYELYIAPEGNDMTSDDDDEEGCSPEECMLEDDGTFMPDGDSGGMFNSVECYEEVPFNSLDRVFELAESIPPQIADALLLGVEGQFASCETWGVPAAPAFENDPVVSDIPTLVVSGEYDPITPPSWGDAAARYLSRSTHLVFPAMGHGSAVDVYDCPTSITLAFLRNPTQSLDTSCIADMGAPDFLIVR